jgi:hypothetical protein
MKNMVKGMKKSFVDSENKPRNGREREKSV